MQRIRTIKSDFRKTDDLADLDGRIAAAFRSGRTETPPYARLCYAG